MAIVDQVITIALKEVGYLEKKSNAQLDDKTANAGRANYTKYGKNMGCNGQAWCDAFVDDCFVQAYGRETAKKLLGGFSNYTPTSAQYFKNMGRWHPSNPEVGDQIFFKNSIRICHTGLVYKMDSARVYTIEGNTSGASGVIANGGGVCKKSYSLNDAKIAGYGRPDYEHHKTANPTPAPSSPTPVSNKNIYTKKQFIKEVQTAIGTTADGIAGPKTLAKTVTVSKIKNRKHKVVKPIQTYLNALGYPCGIVDGIAGVKFDSAIKAYQKAKNCIIDGEITAQKNTWRSLLGLR
ncbi:MAG: peptidoglycan-binding protein [Lachnospiraceae bacterium]|nr:peptidoglycan-binding protein [Lachnospiraceae bacterium]